MSVYTKVLIKWNGPEKVLKATFRADFDMCDIYLNRLCENLYELCDSENDVVDHRFSFLRVQNHKFCNGVYNEVYFAEKRKVPI